MQLTTEREKEIIDYSAKKNLLIEVKAIELLKERENFREILDELLGEETFIVSRQEIENKLLKTKLAVKEETIAEVHNRKGFRPIAREHPSSLKILEEHNTAKKDYSGVTVKDFLDMFQNKFKRLSEMLKKRHGLLPKPIKRIATASKNEEVDIIGMVYRKWQTKNGHTALHLEDLEEKCIVLALKSDALLFRLAEHVLQDDVIGIKGTKFSENLVIAREILWPDIPLRKQKTIENRLSIAGLSDMHVGSRLFLEKEFNDFLSWISGKCPKKEKETVGRIKYILVTGDNVDGIGIYPNQFRDLRIRDIFRQYEEFCRLIAQIPEYIEVVIAPGNHDSVRRADPQPAIEEELVKELKHYSNIHLVGSPAWLEIEGLRVLMYHGASIHDLIASTGFLSYLQPEKAMIELLIKRNLMPTYGMGQPYTPTKNDSMVIKELPDYVFCGDMHHNGYANYRGTTIINSGTWQARTAYQSKLGHIPTPGVVPIVELDTAKIREKRFYLEKSGEQHAG